MLRHRSKGEENFKNASEKRLSSHCRLVAEQFLSQVHQPVIPAHLQRVSLLEHVGNILVGVDELRQEVFVCRLDVRLEGANSHLLQRGDDALGPAALDGELGDPRDLLENGTHCLHSQEPQLGDLAPVFFVRHRHHQCLGIVRLIDGVSVPEEANCDLDVAANGEVVLLDLLRLLLQKQQAQHRQVAERHKILGRILEFGQIVEDKLEQVVEGDRLLDELRLQNGDVHENIARADDGSS